jgi:hypothetical protein
VQKAQNTWQQMKNFSQKVTSGQIQRKSLTTLTPIGNATGSPRGQQQPQVSGGGSGSSQPSQPRGYFQSLGDNLGLTPILRQIAHPVQAYEADRARYAGHPLQQVWDKGVLQNPGIAPAIGLYQGAKRGLGELGQAYDMARQGNGWGVAQHTLQAVPFLGPAMTRAADQAADNGMGAPGNSYWQDVGRVWGTPGAMGTLTGAALQAAPVAEGIAGAVRWGRPASTFPRLPDSANGNILDGTPKPVEIYYPGTNTVRSNFTREEIGELLKNLDIPYETYRNDVYAGNINKGIERLNNGEVAPPIDVVDHRGVWDGANRVVSGVIHGSMPAEKPMDLGDFSSIYENGTRPFRELNVRRGFK